MSTYKFIMNNCFVWRRF